MKTRKVISRLFAAVVFFVLAVSFSAASAALVFYENFEAFSTGGWASGSTQGDWTVNVSGVSVAETGLSYSGGDVWVHGGANALQFSANSNSGTGQAVVANFGSQTGVLYFSFLAEVADERDGTTRRPWLQPMLSPNATGDSYHASVIVNAGPTTYFGGSGGETAARIRSTGSVTELLADYAPGDTVFVVGKLWKSDSGNYDRFSVALNPTTLTEPGSWTATVENDLGASSVEYIRFRTDQISGAELAWIDEIRIGTTYAAALGMADGLWTATQDGNWAHTTNWQDGVPAYGPNQTATFNVEVPAAGITVTTDPDRIIGNLVFGDADPSTAGSWVVAGNPLTLATADVPTITVGSLGDGAVARITAAIGGTQGLMKAGEGTLVLSASNNYGASTSIQDGTLQIGNNDNSTFVGAANHEFIVADGAQLVFSRNRNESDFTTQSITGEGDVVFRGQAGGYFRFPGSYSGTLDYTGKTIIDMDPGNLWYRGALWLLKEDVLPDTSVVDLQRGTLVLQNQTSVGLTIAGLEGNAETYVAARNPGQKLTLDVPDGETYSYAGTIGRDPRGDATQSYDSVALTKRGLGTQILTGHNTYDAGTTILAGTLQIGDNDDSPFVGGSNHQYTVADGAQLVFSRNVNDTDFITQSITGAGDVVFRGQANGYFRFLSSYSGTLDYTGKTVVDLDAGSGWVNGVLWLEAPNVLPDASVVDLRRGRIILRADTSGDGLIVAGLEGDAGGQISGRLVNQRLTIDVAEGESYTFNGRITTWGGNTTVAGFTLTKRGLGTQVLTGANTYTGQTVIEAGTLQIGDGTGSALGASSFTVAADATLVFDHNTAHTDFTTQSIGGEGDVVFRGQGTGTYRFLPSGSTAYTGNLTYTGKTVVDLDPSNTWHYGTLWLEKDDVLPHATVVDIQRGKIYLRYQTASGLTIAGLEGNAGTYLVPRDGQPDQKLTIDVAEGQTYTYAGTLGSDGTAGGGTNLVLTKKGLGTQVLTGANQYASGTAITAGTLVAGHAGALGTGSITVGANGTLGIADGVAFTRPLTIDAGGRVSAGDGSSPGSVASVLMPAASLAPWESRSPYAADTLADILWSDTSDARTLESAWIDSAGKYYSDVLTLGGIEGDRFVLAMSSTQPPGGWLNIGWRDGPGHAFEPLGTDFQGLIAWNASFTTLGQYGVDALTNSVWVVTDSNSQFAVIPEPGAWLLLLSAFACGLLVRRRRR